MPQSRRPERPRSSRDHHSKPLGAICRSSASTFSAGATLKCHISGIPALPETRGIPDPPDPASDPFNGGGPPRGAPRGGPPPLKGSEAGSGGSGIPRVSGSAGIPDIWHFRVAPAENVDALERQIAPRGFEWWSRELLGRSGRRD